MNKNKKMRIRAIKEILSHKRVKSQYEMAWLLKKKGFKVSQATIARDFKEIGVVRVEKNGTIFYKMPAEEDTMLDKRLKAAFENFVSEIKVVGNLVLIKTVPGNASGVASIIDRLGISGIEGSIAGDDTILIVTNPKKTKSVFNTLNKYGK